MMPTHVMAMLGAARGRGLVVSPNTGLVANSRFDATCWAGVQFGSNGIELANTNVNIFEISRGFWLDVGDPGDVWIERTINLGGLNVSDPGAGRHNLGTTRTFNQNQVPNGSLTTNITFDFWDAASGGNLLDTVTYDIIAENSI